MVHYSVHSAQWTTVQCTEHSVRSYSAQYRRAQCTVAQSTAEEPWAGAGGGDGLLEHVMSDSNTLRLYCYIDVPTVLLYCCIIVLLHYCTAVLTYHTLPFSSILF